MPGSWPTKFNAGMDKVMAITPKPPLEGLRVVELAGLAPSPFTTLLLADFGASVLRIDRPHPLAHSLKSPPPTPDLLARRKSSIAINLKSPAGIALLRTILQNADVLIDPYRPGVLEGLGLNPESLLASNQRLVIARLTGFRRDGKYADMAGHDINYLAVSGILSQLGRSEERPYAPANIVADFAGGGLTCAFGVLLALLQRQKNGKGQVVESNMVDGSAYLGSMMRLNTKTPLWNRPRGENILDGACPFYDVYQCKDGGYMAVGALEPQFFAELIKGLGVDPVISRHQNNRQMWPNMRKMFRSKFLQKTRAQWEEVFTGIDACCTPVLGQEELEAAGYCQRHAVDLKDTPGLEIDQSKAWTDSGLSPGSSGEDVLHAWLGWRKGKEYDVEQGGLVQRSKPKL